MDFCNHVNTYDTVYITNTVEFAPLKNYSSISTQKTSDAVKMVFVGGLMGPCFVMVESSNYSLRKIYS